MVIFFFLTYDETRKLSNIYKVQDITLVCSNVKGRGITFFTGNLSPLSITVINKKSDPTFNIDRIKIKY